MGASQLLSAVFGRPATFPALLSANGEDAGRQKSFFCSSNVCNEYVRRVGMASVISLPPRRDVHTWPSTNRLFSSFFRALAALSKLSRCCLHFSMYCTGQKLRTRSSVVYSVNCYKLAHSKLTILTDLTPAERRPPIAPPVLEPLCEKWDHVRNWTSVMQKAAWSGPTTTPSRFVFGVPTVRLFERPR